MKAKRNLTAMAAVKLASAVRSEMEKNFSVILIGPPDSGKGALKGLLTFEAKPAAAERILRLDVPAGTDAGAVMAGRRPDLVMVMLDASEDGLPEWAGPLCRRLEENGDPILAIVNKADLHAAGPVALARETAAALGLPESDVKAISLLKGTGIKEDLIPAIAHALRGISLSLGSSLPIFRDAVADRLISTASVQNAAFAFAGFVPGADFPVLVTNQLRMVLQLAALYGEQLGPDRLIEGAATFAVGIAFRTAARELLDLLPAWGWLIKGGISYGGTVALGKSARVYFQSGRTVTPSLALRTAKSLARRCRASRDPGSPASLP